MLEERKPAGAELINLFHGNSLPPHPVVKEIFSELRARVSTWSDLQSEHSREIRLHHYRIPTQCVIPQLAEAILDDFCCDIERSPQRLSAFVGAGVTHVMASIFNHLRIEAGTHGAQSFMAMAIAPTYTSYMVSATCLDCSVNVMKAAPDGRITVDQIGRCLAENPGTRALLLIHPNNPTGQIFSRTELEGIARLAIKHDLLVISDEIFIKLTHAPSTQVIPFAAIEVDGHSMLDRTITLRGVSKDRGLAALRLGWGVAKDHLLERVKPNTFVYGTIFAVDDLAQYLGAEVMRRLPPEYFVMQSRFLTSNKALVSSLVDEINEKLGIQALCAEQPETGMFQLIDASGLAQLDFDDQLASSDMQLSKFFAEHFGVGLLPGSVGGYDPMCRKLRLTLTTQSDEIIRGMERIRLGLLEYCNKASLRNKVFTGKDYA